MCCLNAGLRVDGVWRGVSTDLRLRRVAVTCSRPASRGDASLLSDPVRSSSKPGTPDLVSSHTPTPCEVWQARCFLFVLQPTTCCPYAPQDWVAAHVASSSGAPKKLGPGPVLPPIGGTPLAGLEELQDEDARHAVEAMLEKKRPTSANKKFLAKYGLTGWTDGRVRVADQEA